MFDERIEVERRNVFHVRECDLCCGSGKVDSVMGDGVRVECHECGGVGERWDGDCDCVRCIETVIATYGEEALIHG
jgi:hypothetical protein